MSTNNTSSKRSLLIMVAVFVLPVILAYTALKFDWFNKAATNRGELIQPVIEASMLLEDSGANWHLLYIIPKVCDTACENALYSVQQIYVATGKESDRVQALFLFTENSAIDAVNKAKEIPGALVLQKEQIKLNNVFKNVGVDSIFISDTLHNVVLKYPVTADKQQTIMDSRDILADLKKLLKLSRIG